MIFQGQHRAFAGYFFIFILALVTAGCSGGGGSGNSSSSQPQSSSELILKADTVGIVGVIVGDVATLNGNKSTSYPEVSLSYAWSFTHKPDGSNAQLQNANSATPSFIADVKGIYMI